MWESLWTGNSSPEGGGWLLLVRIETIHDQSNWELQASLACGCRWGFVSLLVPPCTQELIPSSQPVPINPEGLPEGPPRHTPVASLLRHTTPATPTWEGPVSAGWSSPLLGSGALRNRGHSETSSRVARRQDYSPIPWLISSPGLPNSPSGVQSLSFSKCHPFIFSVESHGSQSYQTQYSLFLTNIL